LSVSDQIVIEVHDAICTITLNRPEKRNALTPDMLRGLSELLGELGLRTDVRCVVVTGAGDRAFSAGYDISSIGEQGSEMMRDYVAGHPLVEAVRAIESYPYPVIAMINGHALGGGLELALACDIRIAADNARFGMPPAKLGIIYPYTGIRRFLNLIGLGLTKELFLVGDPIDARRAEAMGLVNTVTEPGRLKETVYAMARTVASNAPLSMKTMKAMINLWQATQRLAPEDEERIKELIREVEGSEDYREGQRAFAEKRRPVFKGK